MAFQIKPNALHPLLALIAVAFLIVVIASAFFDRGPETVKSQPMTSLPEGAQEPEADTPADTIKAIKGQLAEIARAVDAGKSEMGTELDQESTKLREDIARDVHTRLSRLTTAEREADQRARDEFEKRFQGLEAMIQGLTTNVPETPVVNDPETPASSDSAFSDLPVGFGLDPLRGDDYMWVTPLDGDVGPTAPVIPAATQPLPSQQQASLQSAPTDVEAIPDRPFVTIPNLATLIGSRSFTALIGRVPIGGSVRDPVPFRVLIGRDNLAASGLRVPNEIVSMVFEGVAVGDWTLACVEGSLHTATFVFEDGTIRTVTTREQGTGQQNLDQTQERLGYIADRFGTPCIPGKRVSNAPTYLAGRVGLRAAGAAAEAAAASQTTQIVGGANGTITNSVTGDQGRFILGRTLSDGFDEVDRYLEERMNDAFDAIFVEAGIELAVLIQKEIAIDYEPEGRRLAHGDDQNRLRRISLD